MTGRTRELGSLEDLILSKGLLGEETLRGLVLRGLRERKPLDQLLVETGMSEEQVARLRAEHLGYEFADPTLSGLPPRDVLQMVRAAYARRYRILPLRIEGSTLVLAMVEPRDAIALDETIRLFRLSPLKIRDARVVMTSATMFEQALGRFYGTQAEQDGAMGTILDRVAASYKPSVEVARVAREDATEHSAPVVQLSHKIVEEAYSKRASDIHLEPAGDHLRVRYRIDGVMAEVMRVPKYAQDALISRYKIMAEMRIDERRVPQDGRIDFSRYNATIPVDLRASTVPTPFGEDLVLRILDKKSELLSIEMLGFGDRLLKAYREAILRPHGIILHVGPTGSGKTSALYAALRTLDTPDVKIVSAEDPIEYSLGGRITQSNINPAAGYTFAKAIRAFMRHDPDIILIGEIRDLETARTAVEASLTGHRVFSTLHTNDAVGTVARLQEMGIEPYLLAESLVLVCSQRLVRKVCTSCAEEYAAGETDRDSSLGRIESGTRLVRGRGCRACEGTGYRGRTGIFEMLVINDDLKKIMLRREPLDTLREAALACGMETLWDNGLKKVVAGVTTVGEVVRQAFASE